MSTARRTVIALAALVLPLALAAPTATAAPSSSAVLRQQAPAPVAHEEDEPGWECWREGNRACGSTMVDPRTGESVAVVVQYDRRGRVVLVRPIR